MRVMGAGTVGKKIYLFFQDDKRWAEGEKDRDTNREPERQGVVQREEAQTVKVR